MRIYLLSLCLIASYLFIGYPPGSEAKIPDGENCSTCHTMHYSQDSVAPVGAGTTGPYEGLLTDDCIGCHSDAGSTPIVNNTPIVFNASLPASTLAGGNFYYVTMDNANGHNPVDIGYLEDALFSPPGAVHASQVSNVELTCAGKNGCHGVRDTDPNAPSGIAAIMGSHHNDNDDTNNLLLTADQTYNSYRFLMGVKGWENNGAYKWQNLDESNHNEYLGDTAPMSLAGCASDQCHYSSTKIKPLNGTMSGFCATCHGNFHSLQGIGGSQSSPFTRHPTDITMPGSGEYSSYITYSVEAPVARLSGSLPSTAGNPSSSINQGSDVVMCLSCHTAHASPNYKMLRWDYKGWPGNALTSSCSICHTSKD